MMEPLEESIVTEIQSLMPAVLSSCHQLLNQRIRRLQARHPSRKNITAGRGSSKCLNSAMDAHLHQKHPERAGTTTSRYPARVRGLEVSGAW